MAELGRLDPDAEREHLEAFLDSPGWALFCAYLDENWGPKAYRARCRREIGSLPRNGELELNAQLSVSQIEAATSAIELVRAWPVERVKKLRAAGEKKRGGMRPWRRGSTDGS